MRECGHTGERHLTCWWCQDKKCPDCGELCATREEFWDHGDIHSIDRMGAFVADMRGKYGDNWWKRGRSDLPGAGHRVP